MKHFKIFTTGRLFQLLLVVALFTSCAKDDYYTDGGLANPKFDGTMMQYLESKPIDFDTLVQVIKLAGLEEEFNTEELTFFAPRDRSIKDLIGSYDIGGSLNRVLYDEGKDTIKVLSDIDGLIWRKYLERYMFKGKNKLMDYPQIDFSQLLIYGGQNYYAKNNTVSNIGVVYNDLVERGNNPGGGVKYLGYRSLFVSYIQDVSRPTEGWLSVRVTSSDIEPNNGIVHVLDIKGRFGFNPNEVMLDVYNSKR